MKPAIRTIMLFASISAGAMLSPVVGMDHATSSVYAQAAKPGTTPFTLTGLENALKLAAAASLPPSEVVLAIRRRGVDFEVTAAIETELTKAGATRVIIQAVRNNFRGAPTPAVAASAPISPAPAVTAPATATPPVTGSNTVQNAASLPAPMVPHAEAEQPNSLPHTALVPEPPHTPSAALLKTLKLPKGDEFPVIAFSPDAHTLASTYLSHTDGHVFGLLDVDAGKVLKEQRSPQWISLTNVFSPDGRFLITAGGSKTMAVLDVVTGSQMYSVKEDSANVIGAALSPDNRLLALLNFKKSVTIWHLPLAKKGQTFQLPEDCFSASFSPDGQTLALPNSKETGLWDVNTGRIRRTLDGVGPIFSVAFSPDGKLLASIGNDGRHLQIWDAASGKLLKQLSDSVGTHIAFSPDSQTLATSSKYHTDNTDNTDNTIKLWKMPSGELEATLEGHTDYINSIAFSPDGRILASASKDGTIKLWSIPAWPK